MSTSIVSRTISSVDDQRIVLSNSQIAVPLSVDSADWTKLRVGIRCSVTDSGANLALTNPGGFFLGLMASPSADMANGPLGNSTSHYIGFLNDASTWTRTAGQGYFAGGTSCGTKVGSTYSQDVDFDDAAFRFNTGRCAWIIELDKTNPASWDMDLVRCYQAADLALDISQELFLSAMEFQPMGSGVATLLGYTGTGQSFTSFSRTVDEGTNGTLNAVVVGWSSAVVDLEISDLAYTISE